MIRVNRVAALALALLLGCDGDSLHLDKGRGDRDERFEALRARLAIEIRPGPSGYSGDSSCSESADELSPCCNADYCSARGLAELLFEACVREVPAARDASTCGTEVRTSDAHLCTAERLLQIVENPTRTLYPAADIDLEGDLDIGRQDAESNAQLAIEAIRVAESTLRLSRLAISEAGAGGPCARDAFDDPAGTGPFADTTLGAELAHFYVDALHTADDAARHVGRAGAAVSDAELSRAADRATAAAMRNAPFASRAAAAHVLVGGEHGLPAFTTNPADGVFDRPPLTAAGQRALRILRWLAIDPAVVANTSIGLTELMEGGASVPEAELASIRSRLTRFLSDPTLAMASADAIYERLGVDAVAMSEAREWIAAQNRAFDRPMYQSPLRKSQVLPAELLPDGTMSDFPLFAATRLPPTPPPSVYWSAVARFDSSPPTLPSATISTAWPTAASSTRDVFGGGVWGDETHLSGALVRAEARDAGRTYGSLRQEALLEARRLVGVLTPQTGETGTLATELLEMRELMGGLLGEMGGGSSESSTLLGRARACADWVDPDGVFWIELDLEMAGVTTVDGLDIVLGQDGLTCAVQGTIDGVACTEAQLTDRHATFYYALQDHPGGISGRFVAGVFEAAGSGPRPDLSSYFVVRRDPAATGPMISGEYEPLVGFVLTPPDPASDYCIGAPITRDLDGDVERLIAPSVEDPARSAMNCSGLPEGMQLPLENELTRDSYEEESSWRHYLALARSASDQSDALLDELARTRLEMDQRAEAQADILEQLCGVRLNVTTFARTLPDRVTPLPCGDLYTPVDDGAGGVQCVLNTLEWAKSVGAVSDTDATRLEQCLGDSSTDTWAVLGDEPVCVWHGVMGDSTTLCEGASTAYPCPAIARGATSDADCAEHLPNPAYAPTLIADPRLALFSIPVRPAPPGGGGGGAEETLPCEALARIRGPSPLDRDDDLETVLESSLLSQTAFTELVRPLGWVASAGDFSRVTYGGTIASTGSPVSGGTSVWPRGTTIGGINVISGGLCPSGDVTGDPFDNSDGVFCVMEVPQGTTETDRRARARTNDMLGRAVIAARIIAGLPLDTVAAPYMPRILGSDGDYYPAPGAEPGYARPTMNALESVPVTETYFDARVGILRVDQPGDAGGAADADLAMIGGWTEWLTGAIEWSHCPYDAPSASTCPAIVDYEGTLSDPVYPGLPLIIRTLATDGDSYEARRFFRSSAGGGILRSYLEQADAGTALGALDADLLSDLHHLHLSRLGDVRVGYDTGHGCNGATGCECAARPLACVAAHGDAVRSMAAGNLLHLGAPYSGDWNLPSRVVITPRDILNGLELTCVAARTQSEHPGFGCDEPPEIHSVGDLLQAEAFLRCQADSIEAQAGASVIRGLPANVVESILSEGPDVLGNQSGDLAAQAGRIGGALESLSEARYRMADEIRAMAGPIRQLRTEVARSSIAHRIEDLALQSTIFDQITSCVVAVASIPTSDTAAIGGRAVAAAASCINSGLQIGIASAISSLRHEDEALRLEGLFAGADTQMVGATRGMSEAASSIRTQLAEIDAALSELNSLRAAGRRALDRALYLETDGTDAHNAVTAQYRARYNTLLTRYREAHERAVRTAYIARRAVEQRLAMPLDTMTDPMPTVEAPASWVDQLCAGAFDPDRAAGVAEGPDGGVIDYGGEEGYAAAYIGDYVDKLEQVVESYSFVHPFVEGRDTAVISIRDDVFQVRAPCEVDSPNLLYQSNHLNVLATEERPGWQRDGCDEVIAPDAGIVDTHCVSARAMSPDEGPAVPPPAGSGVDLGAPAAFTVRFGGSDAATVDTRLAQHLTLEPGRYRVSWYARGTVGQNTVITFDADGVRLDPDEATYRPGTALPDGWTRYHTFFDVPDEQVVSIAISPRWTTPGEVSVEIAGIMLEDVSRVVVGDPWRMVPHGSGTARLGDISAPGPYYATSSVRTRVARECIDHTGEEFRGSSWGYGCTRVCPDGYDGTCDPRISTQRCYYQTTIPIASSFIERRLTGTPTGFAGGNFNYRIDDVAVNVVGTGLRVCDEAPGCYGSGNLSYSILHVGAYTVTNARGELYLAPLFPGRLESARALAAERYLSNPISSADEALIQPYRRFELAGRPLGGSLVLRIWDEPTLDFDRLEDVQLVLHYRYWQHQR